MLLRGAVTIGGARAVPEVEAERWAAMLAPWCKQNLPADIASLCPSMWWQDVHVNARMTLAFLRAWDTLCDPPPVSFLEVSQAALSCQHGAGKLIEYEILQAVNALSKGISDWSKHCVACIPLNAPRAGDGICAGVHWSLLTYVCDAWPIKEGSLAQVRGDPFIRPPIARIMEGQVHVTNMC